MLMGSLKSGAAAAVMGVGLWWWLGWRSGSSAWLLALGGIAVGGLVYGLLMAVLRVEELQGALHWVKNRLRRN